MYVYRVVEIREKMIGGKMSGEKLERLLNEYAAQGWRLKSITSADVKGRIGPGGVEGLLVTFEGVTDQGTGSVADPRAAAAGASAAPGRRRS